MALKDDWIDHLMQDQEEDDLWIDLKNLTNDEWLDMKRIGIELYEKGDIGKDQFKIAVYAFMRWLVEQDKVEEYDYEPKDTEH